MSTACKFRVEYHSSFWRVFFIIQRVAMATNSTPVNLISSTWTCFHDNSGNLTLCTPAMPVQQNPNSTGDLVEITARDASWILTSAVIIFTMQTGFGLLESGCVSRKSEINIMVKNALDVVFGGFTYWAAGFGFSFGTDKGTNPFIGVGNFFLHCPEEERGYIYALFLFQLSFATTATTIVSGAMTERTKLLAYNVFSLISTFIYCIPAHWVWAESGFLYKMGVIDVAGCGPVHLIGGMTGLIATIMLGPRRSAVELLKKNEKPPIHGPVKCILGMFMLWWGWLRFNSGSVFIVSTSSQWQYAVTAAVNTILASIGGGITSVGISWLINRVLKRNSKYDVGTIVSGVLGALVSITSVCTLCLPWEAFAIGCIAPALTSATELLLLKLNIDDPVGVIPVHLTCAIWGLLTVGLFTPEHETLLPGTGGLIKTGKPYLLGVQTLTVVIIAVWSAVMSYICLKLIDLTIGLRLSSEDEDLGVDMVEHGSHHNLLDMDVLHMENIHNRSTDTQRNHIQQLGESVTEPQDSNEGQGSESEHSAQKAKDLMAGFLTLCDSMDMQVNFSRHSSDNITIEVGSKCSHADSSETVAYEINSTPGQGNDPKSGGNYNDTEIDFSVTSQGAGSTDGSETNGIMMDSISALCEHNEITLESGSTQYENNSFTLGPISQQRENSGIVPGSVSEHSENNGIRLGSVSKQSHNNSYILESICSETDDSRVVFGLDRTQSKLESKGTLTNGVIMSSENNPKANSDDMLAGNENKGFV